MMNVNLIRAFFIRVVEFFKVTFFLQLQAFSYLQSTEKLSKFFHSIIQNVQVFARVAPKQKVNEQMRVHM